MSQVTTVHVSGIASTTTEKEVHDFFSFCGKITALSVTPESGEPNAPKSATVTFEKEAAAKTALLLDNTQLGTSTVHVSAAHTIDEIAGPKATDESEAKDEFQHDLEQEDKPRSRIVAEYLAQGYVIGDHAIEQAILLDKKHGFSTKFTNALKNFDQKYHATERAREFDEKYKITDNAANSWKGLHSYFEKALDTPTGQKVRDFYIQTDKQVRDIHNEARRLADLKIGKYSETDVKPVEQTIGGASGAPGGTTGAATATAPATAPTGDAPKA